MSENKLLKDINRELKLISLEKSEKNSSKNDESKNDVLTVEEKEVNDEVNDNDDSTILSTDDTVEELAKEKIDDIKEDVGSDVLSSDPSLLNDEDKPVERNEIDDVESADGILNKPKQDITSKFIDPDSKEENDSKLKVVDTNLGVFTVLNYDEDSVLLLDCNKQKIQISLEDFNNLHPFEIRDEQLSTINDFKSAYNKDLSDEEELKNSSEDENIEGNQDQDGFENTEDEEDFSDGEDLSDDLSNFGESVVKEVVKDKEDVKENNVLSEIQKQLSRKQGVSETIRSDIRSKNRCVLVARKTKSSKDKDICMNEAKPKNKSLKTKAYESKTIIKKEATQPSGIYVSPKSLSSKNKKDNFDITDVMTIKDGKYIFVKLEGESKIAYLKLKSRKNLLSINELNLFLKERNSFFESLNFVCNDFYILEKEIVMKRFRKYESEDVENIENEFDEVDELDDVEIEDEDLEEDVDSSEDEVEEEDSEKEGDSISFSTEINGVRYSGTLYRDDYSEDEDDEEETDDEVDEDQEDDDLILTSDEELDSLDFPEGLDESVIKARARIYGKRYDVSFCDVKRESVKRAKIEMRRHNIVEAWNSLVRGAKYIKC